jgi:hypothetical protein
MHSLSKLGSALVLTLALLAVPGVPRGSPSFDGKWSVQAFPNSDKGCDGVYQFPVQVIEGSVTYIGRGAIRAEGGIQADGTVEVSFHGEGDRLDARGKMSGPGEGRGTWEASADGCSGVWVAHRS